MRTIAMVNMLRAWALLLIAGLLAGCSVGMALSGKHNPNLGAVKVGTTRGEVEMHLGSPIQSTLPGEGIRMDVYEYEIGNEPSAGRAIGHGVLDLVTLGIWEVVGTPIEGIQGERYRATITYGTDDTVTDIKTVKVGSGM